MHAASLATMPTADVPGSSAPAGGAHAPALKADASPYTEIVEPEAGPQVDNEDEGDFGDDDDSVLFDDALSNASSFAFEEADGPDACTAEEAEEYRLRLRRLGLEAFITRVVGYEEVSVRKLCNAFRVGIPPRFQDDEDKIFQMLGCAMIRELHRRARLSEHQTLDDAVELLKTRKNIIVVTGAGISTSLGIPDFRSKNTGFYDKLRDMGFDEPEEVFELNNFDEDPTIFYSLAGDILPIEKKTSPTHHFIRMIQDRGQLLRNYTQNIDNVEGYAGVEESKLIQCHGSWARATCRKCGHNVPGNELFESIRKKEVARCEVCKVRIQEQENAKRPGIKRKRSGANGWKPRKGGASDSDDDSEGDFDVPEPGVMKPNITFFGEPLPDRFFDVLQNTDRDLVDLVIVIGTSMKVAPVSEIPNFVPPTVPQMYISRDPINHINFDITLLGDCDTIITELCRRAGWDIDHPMVNPDTTIAVAPTPFPHMHQVTAVANAPVTVPLGSATVNPIPSVSTTTDSLP